MSPAKKIILLFGGVRPMATAMGIPPTTVQRWKQSGFIPSRRQSAVLKAARAHDISIGPADFFPREAA